MNIATRIEQLEKRRETLLSIWKQHVPWDDDVWDVYYRLSRITEGQIQALKWVQAEREREMKELGELLKEMGRRNTKQQ